MAKSTRVKALLIKGRKTYVLRWKDRATGKWRDQATDIPATEKNRRRANDAARDKEQQLAGKPADLYTWQEFEERYKGEWLAAKSHGYLGTWENAIKCLKGAMRVELVTDIDNDMLHKWATWMRRQGFAEDTIRSYLGTLRAGLNWAADVQIITVVPRFPRIRGVAKMGGRPLTREELERMKSNASQVRVNRALLWENLLEGLWWSGLRISEAVKLTWEWNGEFAVDLEMASYRIRKQKSRKAEYAPMAPEFLKFLLQTPESDRSGLVFRLDITARQASRVVSEIGEKAGVVTGENGEHATAHDLRRSFGSRWAERVHPAVLQKLMRHRDIATTMKYYVRLDSSLIAKQIAGLGDEMGESPKDAAQSSKQTKAATSDGKKS